MVKIICLCANVFFMVIPVKGNDNGKVQSRGQGNVDVR